MPVNILGSIVAAVLSMIFGFLWYSDSLLGRRWRAEMGVSLDNTGSQKSQSMTKQIILGLVGEFITALVLSYLLYFLGAESILKAMAGAFVVWLGFSATLQFGEVLWARHSMRLFFINTTHRLISLLLMAVVLVLI